MTLPRPLQSAAADGSTICMEKLDEVWPEGLARINNGLDARREPFTRDEIVQRAMIALGEGSAMARMPYHLINNNCEHFATFVRNGWGISEQVARATLSLRNELLTAFL